VLSTFWTGIETPRKSEPYNLLLMNNLYEKPPVAWVLQIQVP
jgi:hypothetical protein